MPEARATGPTGPSRPGGAPPAAAIVVAGGGGRRLGGVDKPGLRRDGTTLLDVALNAVRPPPAAPGATGPTAAAGGPGPVVVVVGPARTVPDGVIVVREDPPGGGPAAGVVAGVGFLQRSARAPGGNGQSGPGQSGPGPSGPVVLLAADLPRVTPATIERLVRALHGFPTAGAAVLVDDTGRRQLLLAVWRPDALARAVDGLPDRGRGRALRSLYDGVAVVEVPGRDQEWADVDTPGDRARWWPAG